MIHLRKNRSPSLKKGKRVWLCLSIWAKKRHWVLSSPLCDIQLQKYPQFKPDYRTEKAWRLHKWNCLVITKLMIKRTHHPLRRKTDEALQNCWACRAELVCLIWVISLVNKRDLIIWNRSTGVEVKSTCFGLWSRRPAKIHSPVTRKFRWLTDCHVWVRSSRGICSSKTCARHKSPKIKSPSSGKTRVSKKQNANFLRLRQ